MYETCMYFDKKKVRTPPRALPVPDLLFVPHVYNTSRIKHVWAVHSLLSALTLPMITVSLPLQSE